MAVEYYYGHLSSCANKVLSFILYTCISFHKSENICDFDISSFVKRSPKLYTHWYIQLNDASIAYPFVWCVDVEVYDKINSIASGAICFICVTIQLVNKTGIFQGI